MWLHVLQHTHHLRVGVVTSTCKIISTKITREAFRENLGPRNISTIRYRLLRINWISLLKYNKMCSFFVQTAGIRKLNT